MTSLAEAEKPAAAPPQPREKFRSDIQGLRAVAVSLVFLYHLWPNRISGGFVGVDVFFVISGFLITSHLFSKPPRGLRGALEFWSRRVRRLLPASLLVLTVTLIATRLFAPDTQWATTARDVKAAALYFVNWHLASDSVDYLAAEAAASPVQHFWSLSVEEQFYFVWPLLIIVLFALAMAVRQGGRVVVFAGLSVVVAASLAYSIYETAASPASAYFVTPTRVWELGVGGLLAVAVMKRADHSGEPSRSGSTSVVARAVISWLGLGAICWAAFAYDGSTAFPGWRALLPVLGTAAVIGARPSRAALSPGRPLAWSPVQWLGNVSYSLYLWHWPLIVLVPYIAFGDDGALGRGGKAVVIVVSLVLAGLTKRYVEDRFRTPRWGRPLVKPFALAALAMALVVSAASAQTAEVHHREQQANTALKQALSGGSQPCFGAAAIAAKAGACQAATASGTLVPTPLQAAQDKSDAYASVSGKKDCFSYKPSFKVVKCTFGDLASKTNVVLVGNSHAGEWLPAIEKVAATKHWKITTYMASECAFSLIPQQFDTTEHSQDCLKWSQKVTSLVASGGFDLVVMVNRVSVPAAGYSMAASYAQYEKGYQAILQRFSRSHLRVAGIRDTPAPGTSIPDCLAAHPNDYAACNGRRDKWLPPEPLFTAIDQVGDPHITKIDMTDYLCRDDACPAAIGTVPVYFDGSHLTATYATTLAPYLAPALAKSVVATP